MFRIKVASLAGTTIEFFDFYIFATAAVLVFPRLFFPDSDASTALLESFATFSVAFFARPIGAAVFGHFGDRVGRKATLVVSLLTMGIATVSIGLLPTYASIGVLAPVLLVICRFGQGFGLGGEWGGAVLLATENALPGRRHWFGMFPQLGAPIGFFLASALYLTLTETMSTSTFEAWGWRIPFLLSSVLVVIGLVIRLRLTETPVFRRAIERHERVEVPLRTVLASHKLTIVIGIMIGLAVFVLFYLMTVFALSWGTRELGYARKDFLLITLAGVAFFGLTVPLSAWLADRYGAERVLTAVTLAIVAFGLAFAPLFESADTPRAVLFSVIGFSLTGLAYGPLSALLADAFPTPVRYTGASLTFNLTGIFGASLAPYIATWLASNGGLSLVGLYLSLAGAVTLAGLFASARRSRTPELRPAAPR